MNGVELTWPPEAVDESVTIKLILQKPSKYCRMIFQSGLENDLIFGASVINCQPNGQTFNNSLTLRITLEKYRDKFKNLFVLHGRKNRSKDIIWEDITEISTFDSSKNAVSTEIKGFSLIAVLLGSIWVNSKELVARLNFVSFKYTLSALHRSNFQNSPFEELALVFMSRDVYQEKYYREHNESVLTKLKSNGFKELGSTVQKETNYIYNKETLDVSIQLGQDYKPANNQRKSWELTVESSVWWSTGHAIKLPLQSCCTNDKILCGKILVQGQYGHVREDRFCQLDLCGYVKEILGIENLIYNLQPVAQKLELSMELRRQVVSCWQNEEKQLEVILQNWSEKQGDDADPAFLRKTLGELEPKAYKVKERGQMHIRHLRELATRIDRLEHNDVDMEIYLIKEIKYLCGSVFRDCCIEMANSKGDLEFAASTENHSEILATHDRISKEVSSQYRKIRMPRHFLPIIPHLIQAVKEIFKDENIPQIQNGMIGISEDVTLTKINSEIQDAVEKKHILRLFTAVSTILECLCRSNNEDQSQITENEISNWGKSVMIIRMLEFLEKHFETAGSDALRLQERLRIFSIHLKSIMSDRQDYEEAFLSDFHNVALGLIAFAKFDPTRFLRFELKDPSSSAGIQGDDVLRYDKSKEIFSQLFWISKESDEELQLEAIAYVHIDGKLRRIGAFESEITLPAPATEVIDNLPMASLPVVVKREYGIGGSIRVTLYATQKENIRKALEYVMQELGGEGVDLGREKIASSHLKLRSLAKAGTVVKLRLIHRWRSESICLESDDFIALADSSAGGSFMPDSETAAEANQMMVLPTTGDSNANSSDVRSFVTDSSQTE
ncbi:uncharacterized protein LOC111327144 isoform X2 [Stylophora pistillata]|nr:uncharacterized protein LOC111327144 isoform X2 [Stylophora pistillata]